MPQFDLYRNPNPESREWAPYLVDLQHHMLSALGTRIMVPLVAAKSSGEPAIQRLNPTVSVEEESYFLSTAEMASVPIRELSGAIGNLSSYRDELLAAVDLLFTAV